MEYNVIIYLLLFIQQKKYSEIYFIVLFSIWENLFKNMIKIGTCSVFVFYFLSVSYKRYNFQFLNNARSTNACFIYLNRNHVLLTEGPVGPGGPRGPYGP